jgi:hypothetical protein
MSNDGLLIKTVADVLMNGAVIRETTGIWQSFI